MLILYADGIGTGKLLPGADQSATITTPGHRLASKVGLDTRTFMWYTRRSAQGTHRSTSKVHLPPRKGITHEHRLR